MLGCPGPGPPRVGEAGRRHQEAPLSWHSPGLVQAPDAREDLGSRRVSSAQGGEVYQLRQGGRDTPGRLAWAVGSPSPAPPYCSPPRTLDLTSC